MIAQANTKTTSRRALLALLLLVPVPSLGAAVLMYWAPGVLGKVLYGVCKVWLLGLPIVWFLLVERGKFSLSPLRKGGLMAGLGTGVAITAVILVFYALVGREWIDAETFRSSLSEAGFDNKTFYLGAAVYVVLINAAIEEYVWRWFVFRQCERLMPGFLAVLLSAVLFTIHHIVALRAYLGWDVTLVSCAGLLIGATVWSTLYWRYRSIWPGYLSHIGADIAVYVIGWQVMFASASAASP